MSDSPKERRTLVRHAAPLGVIAMAIVFFIVITPISLVLRLLGRDPLQRRFLPGAKSYWIERPAGIPMQKSFREQSLA